MKNFEVSLVKYLCPICGKDAEEGIIMNSLLTEKHAKEVKDLNGKAIGFANHCCKECAKYKDKGIYFIAIDDSKGGKNLSDFYRTGQLVCIANSSNIIEHFKNYIRTLEDGTKFILMAEDAGRELGLWK